MHAFCDKLKIENEWSQLARVKDVQYSIKYVDLYLRAKIATVEKIN